MKGIREGSDGVLKENWMINFGVATRVLYKYCKFLCKDVKRRVNSDNIFWGVLKHKCKSDDAEMK